MSKPWCPISVGYLVRAGLGFICALDRVVSTVVIAVISDGGDGSKMEDVRTLSALAVVRAGFGRMK